MESQWRQTEAMPSSPFMSSCLPESNLQILDIRQSPSSSRQFQVLIRDSTDDQATEYWMSSGALLEDPDLWDSAWYAFCAQITTKRAMVEHVNRARSTKYHSEDDFTVEDMRAVRQSVERKRKLEEGTSGRALKRGIATSLQEMPSGQQIIRLSLQGRSKRTSSPTKHQPSRQPSVSPSKKAHVPPTTSPKSPKKSKLVPSVSIGSPPKTKAGDAASPLEVARDILQKPKSRNCRVA